MTERDVIAFALQVRQDPTCRRPSKNQRAPRRWWPQAADHGFTVTAEEPRRAGAELSNTELGRPPAAGRRALIGVS